MMQWILIVTLVVHILSGIAWVGMSLGMARGIMPLPASAKIRPGQRGAAVVSMLAGLLMGYLAHRGRFDTAEIVLVVGAVLAVIAAVVQGMAGGVLKRAMTAGTLEIKGRQVLALDRLGAGLLVLTVICMAASKYL